MKRYLLLSLTLSASFSLSSCSRHTTSRLSGKHPTCVDKKLEAFLKSGGSCPNGNTVKQYLFQGKKVYVLEPGSCGADMAAVVIDEQCNELGYLGGFTGNTLINNENFGNAVYQQTVYQD